MTAQYWLNQQIRTNDFHDGSSLYEAPGIQTQTHTHTHTANTANIRIHTPTPTRTEPHYTDRTSEHSPKKKPNKFKSGSKANDDTIEIGGPENTDPFDADEGEDDGSDGDNEELTPLQDTAVHVSTPKRLVSNLISFLFGAICVCVTK